MSKTFQAGEFYHNKQKQRALRHLNGFIMAIIALAGFLIIFRIDYLTNLIK